MIMISTALLVSLCVSLLILGFTRITAKPFPMEFNVTEGGANTYTEQDFEAPLTALPGGKIQGLELVRTDVNLSGPDSEDGQDNSVDLQLVRDTQSALIGWEDEDLVYKWGKQIDNSAINGSYLVENPRVIDHTMPDKNGKMYGPTMIERKFHMGLVGTGNAGAKGAQGRMWFHVVSLSAAEVLQDLILDADD